MGNAILTPEWRTKLLYGESSLPSTQPVRRILYVLTQDKRAMQTLRCLEIASVGETSWEWTVQPVDHQVIGWVVNAFLHTPIGRWHHFGQGMYQPLSMSDKVDMNVTYTIAAFVFKSDFCLRRGGSIKPLKP